NAGDGGGAARHYTAEEWTALPSVGRFLATATAQCLSGLGKPLPPSERVLCVLGSTGGGSAGYDALQLLGAAEEIVQSSSGSAPAKEMFSQALEEALGRKLTNAADRLPSRSYTAVARRLLGTAVKVLAVDAACASSLYAIDIGMRALRDG